MFRAGWIARAIRILRHDLTLLTLVAAFVAVSAGALTAAIHETDEKAVSDESVAVVPVDEPMPAVPAEERLAPAEEPLHVAEAREAAELVVIEGELRRGDILVFALQREGVSKKVANRIAVELRSLFNFRRSQPGHEFQVASTRDGRLVAAQYRVSDLEIYSVTRDGDDYRAERVEIALEAEPTRIAGVVTSNLHDAIVALGERGQLANDFSEIFAWDIDFSRSVREGDEFRVLYERLYREDPDEGRVYVGPGKILAATYSGSAGEFSAVYFEPEEGRGGYYRPDGSSVEGMFLRAPLRYSRITSRFTHSRRHPILKVTRPHHGIDYAAPRGTPLWSVADGQVIYRGWGGGFGNLIKIRHSNGFVSYYSHLSRFAKGLKVGQKVQQKQVIGYVGSTGLATGPHVCFRIAKEGRYIDPMRVASPIGPPVAPEQKPQFAAARDVLLAQLDAGPLVAVEEAL
jgi:murein DD-endopeptidase MepM/ murein hydrolase activator NlpD